MRRELPGEWQRLHEVIEWERVRRRGESSGAGRDPAPRWCRWESGRLPRETSARDGALAQGLPMRIVFITAGPASAADGGGATYNREVIPRLLGRGHDVRVVDGRIDPCAHTVVETRVDGSPWEVATLPGADARQATGRSPRARRQRLAFRRIVESFRADVVHANGLKSLAGVASGSVPCVATVHHPGVACPSGTLVRPDGSICQRPMDGTACSICFCSQRRFGRVAGGVLGSLPPLLPAAQLPEGRRPTRLDRTRVALGYPAMVRETIDDRRRALRSVDLWIAPSAAACRVLLRNDVPRSRIRSVPHGITPVRRSDRSGRDVLRFGYVGALSRAKGVDLLVRAFSSVSRRAPCELHLWGAVRAGAEGERFADWLRINAPDRCVLRGRVAAENLQPAYGDIDVLVFPARNLEVFGLVVLEALSAGVPVIASRCGGPEESVRDLVNGLLIRPNDMEDLVSAMAWVAGDADRVRALRAGIGPVRTWDACVSDMERVYEDAISLRRA